MIVQKTIGSSEWTALSTAGQSGSVWLDEDQDGALGRADVRVIHSLSSVAAVLPTVGKRVFVPNSNNDVLICTADSATDIYYARCLNVGDQATISVDMV